jgi:hypothetical protein
VLAVGDGCQHASETKTTLSCWRRQIEPASVRPGFAAPAGERVGLTRFARRPAGLETMLTMSLSSNNVTVSRALSTRPGPKWRMQRDANATAEPPSSLSPQRAAPQDHPTCQLMAAASRSCPRRYPARRPDVPVDPDPQWKACAKEVARRELLRGSKAKGPRSRTRSPNVPQPRANTAQAPYHLTTALDIMFVFCNAVSAAFRRRRHRVRKPGIGGALFARTGFANCPQVRSSGNGESLQTVS